MRKGIILCSVLIFLFITPVVNALDNPNRTLPDLIEHFSGEFAVSNESTEFAYGLLLAQDGRRVTLGGTRVELFWFDVTVLLQAAGQDVNSFTDQEIASYQMIIMQAAHDAALGFAEVFGNESSVHFNGSFMLSITINRNSNDTEITRIVQTFMQF